MKLQRASEIFAAVRRLPEADRVAAVHLMCGDDCALEGEVLSLLLFVDVSPPILDRSSIGIVGSLIEEASADDPWKAGTTFGHYRIKGLLGEGGMGTVLEAEQLAPVRRDVALKLMRVATVSSTMLARFETERQTLARLEHPGIARVYDAGLAPNGRPYFAMELIRGDTLGRYADARRLGVGDRLRLFIPVARAVEHAHRCGVIHRDLKPSNSIVSEVDGLPAPRIIDFGIAKVIGAIAAPAAHSTIDGQVLGTPAYMSPEQAASGGVDVDTRSDVYSLGVVLYELLTGVPPINPDELSKRGLAALERAIIETEPPRPTRRFDVGETDGVARADARSGTPASLRRALSGDIEWIVLKAIEKSRDRRYATAGALADDIERHLAKLPVFASPPSVFYSLRKLAQRRRALVAGVAATLVAIAFGIAGTVIFAVRANHDRIRARASADLSQSTSDFLEQDVLGAADPESGLGRDATVREALAASAANVAARFAGKPLGEAGVRVALGRTLNTLGENESALVQLDLAIALLREHLGVDARETIAAEVARFGTLNNLGQFDESPEELVARAIRVLGPDDSMTLDVRNSSAVRLERSGKLREALASQESLLDDRRRALGWEHPDTLTSMNNVAMLLDQSGRATESEPLHRGALKVRAKLFGPDHPHTLHSMSNLAFACLANGNEREAEDLFLRTAELRREKLGPLHQLTLLALNNVGFLRFQQRRFDEAQVIYAEAFPTALSALGPDHPDTLRLQANLGRTFTALGRANEALPLTRDSLERSRRVFPESSWILGTRVKYHADALAATGATAEATRLYDEAIEMFRSALGPEHDRTKEAIAARAACAGN